MSEDVATEVERDVCGEMSAAIKKLQGRVHRLERSRARWHAKSEAFENALLSTVDKGVQNAEALNRVRSLHARGDYDEHGGYSVCETCCVTWPCRTIVALDGEPIDGPSDG